MTEIISDVLAGKLDAVCLQPQVPLDEQGDVVGTSPRSLPSTSTSSGLILPGSFHPLHAGHRQMAMLAAQHLNVPVEFELSLVNVDKPSLAATDVQHRARQFLQYAPLWITRAATFVEKARLFPGATFIVGVDTLRRLADTRYHQGDPHVHQAALRTIVDSGVRFLVFGRKMQLRNPSAEIESAVEKFFALDELDLPKLLRDISWGFGEESFRIDISSTEIRQRPA